MSQTTNAQLGEYVPLAAVQRLLNKSPNAIKSIALAGAIRTQVIPGSRILYSAEDARRLAERKRVPVAS